MTEEGEEEIQKVDIREVSVGRSKAIVDRNIHKPYLNILPEDPSELDREVHVGGGAKIGRVFGNKVRLEEGTASRITEVASVVGLEEVVIEGYSHINGPALCLGKMWVGPRTVVYGDIVGKEIFIEGECLVKGNVLAILNLNVGKNSRVFGMVFSRSGGVAIGDNSMVFDVVAHGDILLGQKTLVLDSAIWTRWGKLEAPRTKLSAAVDPKIAETTWDLYDMAEGIETLEMSSAKSTYGRELNSNWSIVNDDAQKRSLRVELLKKHWTELYAIAWEFIR